MIKIIAYKTHFSPVVFFVANNSKFNKIVPYYANHTQLTVLMVLLHWVKNTILFSNILTSIFIFLVQKSTNSIT